jgi:hypothetical protein
VIDALAFADLGVGELAALEGHVRFDAEELRLPQHQVGELPGLHGADVAGDAVRRDRFLQHQSWSCAQCGTVSKLPGDGGRHCTHCRAVSPVRATRRRGGMSCLQ